jgi:hypothetical protein
MYMRQDDRLAGNRYCHKFMTYLAYFERINKKIRKDQSQFYQMDVWLPLYFALRIFLLLDIFSIQIRDKILQKRTVLSYDYNTLAYYNRLWVDRLVHVL